MTILLIGLAGLALLAAAGTPVMPAAVVTAIVSVWANGVLANFRSDPQDAPNLAALGSMLAAIASIVLIVVGLLVR